MRAARTLTVLALAPLTALTAAGSAAAPGGSPVLPPTPLQLGARGLAESRTAERVQAGVTMTQIHRGSDDARYPWAVEVNIPSGPSSPDPAAPARSVQDRGAAEGLVAALAGKGIEARAEQVVQTGAVDTPDGVIGYRVRLAEQPLEKARAEALLAQVKAMGLTGRVWNTGWDGGRASQGPWTVTVLTIDPRAFRGELGGTFGPDLQARETTSALAAHTKANAAVNAGFFVMDPKAGAEGDPAGAAQYGGRLVSEPIEGRPVVTVDSRARRFSVVRPSWTGLLHLDDHAVQLDGQNRVPGLIRNCGGLGDLPTILPLHDVTCTDDGEIVAFTPEWGATSPAGEGREIVLEQRTGRVVAVGAARGAALAEGRVAVQATGDRVGELSGVRVGDRVRVDARLTGSRGRVAPTGLTVINGGPELVRRGALHITQKTDGMVHPGNPSFQYGWVLQRNPRTLVGQDARGRVHFVTIDGRQEDNLGASILETAQVARSLGLIDVMNLDGGGSTTMVKGGAVINEPSDATGERPVGDAVYVR